MTEFDDPRAEIERLHQEAEDLADLARYCGDERTASILRGRATRRVRTAARLRALLGED